MIFIRRDVRSILKGKAKNSLSFLISTFSSAETNFLSTATTARESPQPREGGKEETAAQREEETVKEDEDRDAPGEETAPEETKGRRYRP